MLGWSGKMAVMAALLKLGVACVVVSAVSKHMYSTDYNSLKLVLEVDGSLT